jgi:hypothetical protein
MRFATFFALFILVLVGCESKAHKVQQLQAQYNEEYPNFAKACLDEDSSGAAQLLTGEKVTAQEIEDLKAKKKTREAACKPQADHLAQLQKEILAAQQ